MIVMLRLCFRGVVVVILLCCNYGFLILQLIYYFSRTFHATCDTCWSGDFFFGVRPSDTGARIGRPGASSFISLKDEN
jgi:hypothetical protein